MMLSTSPSRENWLTSLAPDACWLSMWFSVVTRTVVNISMIPNIVVAIVTIVTLPIFVSVFIINIIGT